MQAGRPGQVVKLPPDAPVQPNFDHIPVDPSDEELGEGEDVVPLPDAEQRRDRLLNAPVKWRSDDGHVVFSGVIDEVGIGTRTAQRLYRVLFDDGDVVHITQKEAAASWVATL